MMLTPTISIVGILVALILIVLIVKVLFPIGWLDADQFTGGHR